MTRGDGTERCLICHRRRPDQSFYVVKAIWGGPWPQSKGFPICSWEHARRLIANYAALQ